MVATDHHRSYTCPHCNKKLRGPPPAQQPITLRCPHCQQAVRLAAAADESPPAAAPPAAPAPVEATLQPAVRPRQRLSAKRQIANLISSQLALVSFAILVLFLYQWQEVGGSRDWIQLVVQRLLIVIAYVVVLLVQLIFWGVQYCVLVYFLVRHAHYLRLATYYFIWLWYPLLPILVHLLLWILSIPDSRPPGTSNVSYAHIWRENLSSTSGGVIPLIVFAGLWVYFARGLADWLAPKIASYFVSTFYCPGCFETYSAYGKWNCSCGYKDYRENRHLMRYRCPMCKKYTGHTECQRCGVTIFL